MNAYELRHVELMKMNTCPEDECIVIDAHFMLIRIPLRLINKSLLKEPPHIVTNYDWNKKRIKITKF